MRAVVWHDVGNVSVDALRWATEAVAKAGTADPTTVWTQQETIPAAIDACEQFDNRAPGWTKVTLEVG